MSNFGVKNTMELNGKLRKVYGIYVAIRNNIQAICRKSSFHAHLVSFWSFLRDCLYGTARPLRRRTRVRMDGKIYRQSKIRCENPALEGARGRRENCKLQYECQHCFAFSFENAEIMENCP